VLTRIQDGTGDLASLAIAPAYRHRGVGAALLAETEQRLVACGVQEITLEVRQTNLSGLAFWQQMGFVPFGSLPAFYEDGEDAIRMRKRVGSSAAG
jgi:[ribosomal protein S18]-alanine N-acetyltransferase